MSCGEDFDISDVSDSEDVHIPRLNEEDSDDDDKELQAAFSAGLLKSSLIRPITAKKPEINNKEGLLQKLDEISQPDLEWTERLDVTIDVTEFKNINSEGEEVNVDNDFKRELVFYEQAKSSILSALDDLKNAGIPTVRPDDYYAEMAKKDDHMKMVRKKLLAIQTRKKQSEQNRKNFEMRKYGKKVSQSVIQEREKKKRDVLSSLKKFRAGKTKSLDFLEDKEEKPGKKGGKISQLQKLKAAHKKTAKNNKYGFGGKKRNMKANDKNSINNVSGFKRSVHGKKKNVRPGKNRRMAARKS